MNHRRGLASMLDNERFWLKKRLHDQTDTGFRSGRRVSDEHPLQQVDSIAEGGLHAGQLTRGIYDILDAKHKRACWGQPGGPRPTEFTSPPGSGQILQYCKKIGPAPSS